MEQQGISAELALKLHNDDLMGIHGVTGTGVGSCDGLPCIRIFAEKITPELVKQLPREIEGYPLMIEETGFFRAL